MDTNEKIEAFLSGQLNAEEAQAFENELRSNVELQKELEVMKDLHAGINTYGKNQTKQLIANVAKSYHAIPNETIETPIENPTLPAEVDHSIRWGRWALYIALLAAIAIASFFLMFNEPTPKTPAQHYAAYFEAYIPPTGQRSGDLLGYDLNGMANLYRNGNYEALISKIKNIPADKTTNYMRILLAQAYMSNGQYVLAKPVFSDIILTQDPYFTDHAKWFQALNHLKLKEVDSAKAVLQELVKDKGADHYQEAMKLLEELD